MGRADGVACRTVEMFQTFGLAEALLREAYWVNEVRFWGPSEADRSQIVRTGWVQDTPDGISEFPHVIVNQARMQQFLVDHMAKSPSRLAPEYGTEFIDLAIGGGDLPVAVRLRDVESAHERTVRARYVVGCDGAHSQVRRAIGRELRGDEGNHAWGVIDVLANTTFPDWRTKNVVQSDGKGSLLMIPREGGAMVRFYVDLGQTATGYRSDRSAPVDHLIDVTNRILHPYSIDVRSVAWSAVYEVGQRLSDRFDDADGGEDPCVFIAGDACHTHSAKAGQGMNVSMQDAFNLGWKLAAVIEGRSAPSLLQTYSSERHAVAKDLIEFDRFWSSFIAQPMRDERHPERGGVTAEEMRLQYARQSTYTAGLATTYSPSVLTGGDEHQHVARGFRIGTRFHSAPATRVADGRRLQLGHVHEADGRWRLYLFAGVDDGPMLELARWLGDGDDSPLLSASAGAEDVDGVIDVRGVFRTSHHEVNLLELPRVLVPRTGPLDLQDWEKVWAIDATADIFTERQIGPDGAMVVVRPDQYVGHVLPIDARASLVAYFGGIFNGSRAEVAR